MPTKTRNKKKSKRSKEITKVIAGLVPLSVEEIATLTNPKKDKEQVQLPMMLDKRRITIMEDPDMEWPELWLNVFIHGPEAGPSFIRMFARSKCFKSDTPDDADLVVFTGSGHDVNPKLYGAEKHRTTMTDDAIDNSNLSLIAFCLKRGIPMMGVCGGAQILHVAMGGELYQNVDRHNAPHTMWCKADRMLIQRVSSVHHQMCKKNDRMEVLGEAHCSQTRELDNKLSDVGHHSDVEAFFYRERCILGFQGHPEYSGYPKYTEWCLKQIDHNLNTNPDLEYRANDAGSNKLRIKKELMDEYEAKLGSGKKEEPKADMIIVETTTKGK